MASVENARELNSSATDMSGTPASAEVPQTNNSPQSRLAPAPIPESNPWSRQVKPETLARGPSEAFNSQYAGDQGSAPAAKKTTGKEKWMPYTPVVNSNAGANPGSAQGGAANTPPRRGGDARAKRGKQRNSSKTPEAEKDNKNEKPKQQQQQQQQQQQPQQPQQPQQQQQQQQQRQPRKKYPHQPGHVQTPYDMALSLLVQQFDYYFSIDNLCKDIFLRKQMNSNGFIPIQILADFNRVRILSNGDVNVVVEACHWCPATEVVGAKVRLQNGWERWVLPVEDRDAAGRSEDGESEEDTPKFQIDRAVPFVPKKAQ